MKLRVDINADLGEGAGQDAELFELISSANIACGFHAGSPLSIFAAIRAAKEKGVAVGAHPSFDDRENFGREEIAVPIPQLFAQLVYQIGAFYSVAVAAGARARHVKPHGALYNMAVRDEKLAEAIANSIMAVDPKLILFAPAGSLLESAGERAKLQIAREVFADRNYLSDGSLVPRSRSDALLHDPQEAAARVLRMLRDGKVQSVEGPDVDVRAETICVHGDTPGAVEFARELRSQLECQGVRISAPQSSL
jgi:5-oxoprolinase (ATP-hydrolysing) subunit A